MKSILLCLIAVFITLPLTARAERVDNAIRIEYAKEMDTVWITVLPLDIQSQYAKNKNISKDLKDKYGLHLLWDAMSVDKGIVSQTKPIIDFFKSPKGVVKVEVTPLPGNANIQGRCGAHLGASFSIWVDNALTVKDHLLVNRDCFANDTVTHRSYSYEVSDNQLFGY